MKNTSAHVFAPAHQDLIFTGTSHIEDQLLAQLEALMAALDPAALEAPIDTGSSFRGYSIDHAGGSYLTEEGNFITRFNGTAVEVRAEGTVYQMDGLIGSLYSSLRSNVGIDYDHFAGTLINTGVISGKGNAIQQSSAYSGAATLNITNSGLIYSKYEFAIDTALNQALISNSSFIGGGTGAIRLWQTDAGDLTEFSSGIYNQGAILAGGTAVHVHNSTAVPSFLTISNVDGYIVTMDPKNAYSVLVDDATTRVEFANTDGVIVGNVALKGAGGVLYNENATIYGAVTLGRAADTESNQIIGNSGFGRIEGNITVFGQINSLSFLDESVVKGNVHVNASAIVEMRVDTGALIDGDVTLIGEPGKGELGGGVIFEIGLSPDAEMSLVTGDVSIQALEAFFLHGPNGEVAGDVTIEDSGIGIVVNSGVMSNKVTISATDARVFNDGTLSGDIMLEVTDVWAVTNSGTVSGAMSWSGGSGSFFNFGKIYGDVLFGGSTVIGNNSQGVIDGTVNMGSKASTFDNGQDGLITGDVFMGEAGSSFSNFGGAVEGVIYGEAGKNQYYSGFNADTYISGSFKDDFFILWAGPQGTGEDLKYENNGHDTFKDFETSDDSFAFVYDGVVYDTAETSVTEVAEALKGAGGDYDFSFDSETETLTLILEFEGGGQFDVVFSYMTVDAFLAGQSDLASFEYMMM